MLSAYCAFFFVYSSLERKRYAKHLEEPKSGADEMPQPFPFSFMLYSAAMAALFFGLALNSMGQQFQLLLLIDAFKVVLPCAALLVFAMQIADWLYNRKRSRSLDPLVSSLGNYGKTRIGEVIMFGCGIAIVYRTTFLLPGQVDHFILVVSFAFFTIAATVFDLFGFRLPKPNQEHE